jgi:hypothetical protein
MEKILPYLILGLAVLGSQAAGAAADYDKTIDPYVRFLRQQRQTPVDYLLDLFQRYDLVVLCERSHPEVTQYDLLYELAADPRFRRQAGHIFLENGTRTQQPAVESFLMDDTLTEPQAQALLRRIFRDFDWGGSSSRTGVYEFFRKVHRLNRPLPKDQRVHLYPSDLSFDWSCATPESYGEMRQQLGRRDRIMADNVVEKFNEICRSGGRGKALVIMNYRHAFPHLRVERGGKSKTFENMAGFLMAAYPGKVANVMLNNVRPLPGSSDNQLVMSAIQDGKWDAAFAVLGNPSTGFDFQGSPFGADEFDYFALPFPMGKKYQEVFTGYMFYKPLDEHRMAFAIPGLLDLSFADEMLKRAQIRGENRSAAQIAQEIAQSQTTRTCGYEEKEFFPKSDYAQKIRQWLAAKLGCVSRTIQPGHKAVRGTHPTAGSCLAGAVVVRERVCHETSSDTSSSVR